MSEHRDPDIIIAAYFAQQAPDLPDRAFDAVRRDIHGTRQRPVLAPWHGAETRVVARFLLLAATILLLLSLWALSLFGLGGGAPTPSARPAPTLFRSPLYGYSLVAPAGWKATPATVRWDGKSAPSLGANVDQLSGPHLIALGYAGPFAGDLAAFTQDRIAASARDHADTCPPNALDLNQATSVGGQPGVLLGWNCGARIEQAITVRAGFAYAFTIRDIAFQPSLDTADLASIRSMLDSLTFPSAPVASP